MAEIFISVGSNIDPEINVRAAINELKKVFAALRVSPVYRSAAVGFDGEDFLNLVVAADTELAPAEVVGVLQSIEDGFGRDRSQPKFSARTLDLDLLLYGERVSAQKGLLLPRAEITKYAFVLAPLADIAGQHCHPVTGETFEQMWRRLEASDANKERLQRIPFDW